MARHYRSNYSVPGWLSQVRVGRTSAAVSGVVIILVWAAVLLGGGVTSPASAETPAERCARETATYNNAWAQSWAASTGKPADQAPPPPVPYTCFDPGPPTSSTTGPPSVTAPSIPGNTSSTPEADGPGVGAHAPTDIPEAGDTPIVPIPDQPRNPIPSAEGPMTPPSPEAVPGDRSTREVPPGRVLTDGEADYPKSLDGTYPLPTGYDDLGVNEQTACSTNPYDCSRARNSPQIANRESAKYFPGPTVDNRADAARHCIWMASTTEKANSGFAQAIGNAHEQDGGDGNPRSAAMDEHNNQVGIAVGTRHEGNEAGLIAECVTLARDAPVIPNPENGIPGNYDGKLVVIKP